MLSSSALELNSLSIHLVRWSRRADEAMGIPPARASALSVLVFGGDRTMRELADAEMVTQATMCRIVDGLEEAGLAQRVANPADGRSFVVRATAKGRTLMERGRRARVDRLQRVLDAVPPRDRAAVEQALVALRHALTEVAVGE